jgi:hypothetical protein
MKYVAITSGHSIVLMEIGNLDASASMRTRAYAPRPANDTAEIWLTGTFQEMWQLREDVIRLCTLCLLGGAERQPEVILVPVMC